MTRRLSFAPAIFFAAILFPASAFAQAVAISGPSSAFSPAENGDWAHAWIDYLFRGKPLPGTMQAFAAPFAPIAEGLRHALGLYSYGMLLIAAMILFYHIASMVAETAHTGVIFGRRANQVWMPIRLVVAVGLLVPVGSSLNSGQYIVLKIATEGSNLASNAWREIASLGGEHFSGLVAPRGPDVAKLTATAAEMEICRQVYQQVYSTYDDATVRVAGNVNNDLMKLPATRFAAESWRITNILNATSPLCGEVRFSGFRRLPFLAQPATEGMAVMANEIFAFAHEQTDEMFTRVGATASRAAPALLNGSSMVGADVQNDLTTIEAMYRTRLDTERQAVNIAAPRIVTAVLQQSVEDGWLSAARFILEVVRLQEGISALFDHALPEAQEPVFAHPAVARQALFEALDILPTYHVLDTENYGKLATFYGQVGRVVSQVHNWMYTGQISDKDFVPPSSFDIRDRLNAGSDPMMAFSMYGQALDGAAIERGVWGIDMTNADAGYPFAPLLGQTAYNPFAALVEFGQRQFDLATTMIGIAGGGMTSSNTVGAAILLGIAAFGFLLGGLLLIFVVPLLPFLRFLMGILAWVINLFEAIAAMPIVALAHLTPTGEGLSGGLAREAYRLWLGLFARPLLTLFGLVLGILLFTLALAFLNAVLLPFALLSAPNNESLFTVANTGFVLLYDVMVFAAANASFKGIYWLPDQALRWLSRFAMTDSDGVTAATGPGQGPGAPSLMHFFGGSIGGAGGDANVSINAQSESTMSQATGGRSSGVSEAARSHGLKTALFPLYADKTVPPVVVPGAPATPGTPGSDRMTVIKEGGQAKKPMRPVLPEERQPEFNPPQLGDQKPKGDDDVDPSGKPKNGDKDKPKK